MSWACDGAADCIGGEDEESQTCGNTFLKHNNYKDLLKLYTRSILWELGPKKKRGSNPL